MLSSSSSWALSVQLSSSLLPSQHLPWLSPPYSLLPLNNPKSSTSKPSIFHKSIIQSNSDRVNLVVKCQRNFPLISPDDNWGIWTSLLTTGALGLWLEKTKIGSMVSAALVSILVGLAASNFGIIPHEAPAYSIVMKFLLPLTIPLLLFRADMRNVVRSTGTLLLAFLLGSVATVIGTLVAFMLVPMRSLGPDNWKIAAALMGSYIGGAINYVAISEALGTSSSIVAAGVAADNVITAVYFIVLFALAYKVPSEAPAETDSATGVETSDSASKLPVLQMGSALAVSFAICKAATSLTKLYRIQGGDLPVITAIVVILATLLPGHFSHLAPAGDSMSIILMQIFFVVVGAGGSIWNVIYTAPSIFLFAFIQVTVHLVVILGLGKLFGVDQKPLLIASNANVGGPTTACGMAKAKGWESMVVPGILVGIFGISIATFLGIAFGEQIFCYFLFQSMLIAALGCIYLHYNEKSSKSYSERASSRWSKSWRRPVLVMAPLGVASALELVFGVLFVVLMIWSLAC